MAFGPIDTGDGLINAAQRIGDAIYQGTPPPPELPKQNPPQLPAGGGESEVYDPLANGPPVTGGGESYDPALLKQIPAGGYVEDYTYDPLADGPPQTPNLPVPGLNKPNDPRAVVDVEQRAAAFDPEAYSRNARPAATVVNKARPFRSQRAIGPQNYDKFDRDPIVDVGIDGYTKMSYWPAKGLSKAVARAKAEGMNISFSPLQSYRSYDQQAGLHAKLGNAAAPPGKDKNTGSLHQFGFAIDVGLDTEEEYARMDEIMGEYGFARPFPTLAHERHHYAFQPALQPHDPERVWKDNDPRMQQWKEASNYAPPGSIDDLIVTSASMHGLGPKTTSYFSRMLEQESGKRTKDERGNIITSPVGAVGIGQMMPGTLAPYLKARGLSYDDYKNSDALQVDIAAEHFNKVLKANRGNVAKALAEYNGGPGAVQYAETRGAFPPSQDPSAWSNETLNYVSNIMGVSKDQAMKWIAQGPNDTDTGALADYGSATNVLDARKEAQQWADFIQGEDDVDDTAVMMNTPGGAFNPQVYQMMAPDAIHRRKEAVQQKYEHAVAGTKAFLGPLTWGLVSMGDSLLDHTLTHEAKLPGGYIKASGGIFKEGSQDLERNRDARKQALDSYTNNIKPIVDYFQPPLEGVDKPSQDHANMLRGADSFLSFMAGLPWSPEEGGTDITMRSLEGNLYSFGLSIPTLMGSIGGAILVGPEQGLLSKEAFAPVMAKVAAKATAARAGSYAAAQRLGLLPAAGEAIATTGQAIGSAFAKGFSGVAANLENIFTYGVIGAAQGGTENAAHALRERKGPQEVAGAFIQGMMIGGIMGLGIPMGIATIKGTAGIVGEGGARAVAGALGKPIPANTPWKDFTSAAITDYVERMDAASGGEFTQNVIGKVLPFIRQFVEGTSETAQAIEAANMLEDTAKIYDNAAAQVDSQLQNHNGFVKTLSDSKQQGEQALKALSKDNPNIAMWGEQVAQKLDVLETQGQELVQLRAKEPAERVQWAQANQELMQGAKAKDLDDLLAPMPNKKGGENFSKGELYLQEQRKKLVAEAQEKGGITPSQLQQYRKARKTVQIADAKLKNALNSPLSRDATAMQTMADTLRHTSTALQERAKWVKSNVGDPLEPVGKGLPKIANFDPEQSLISEEALGASLDVLDDMFKSMVRDKTWFGASPDMVAFEATRATRALLAGQGVDSSAVLQSTRASLEEGKVAATVELNDLGTQIRNTKAQVRYYNKEGTVGSYADAFEAEGARLQKARDSATDTHAALVAERESVQKDMAKLAAKDPDIVKADTAYIAEQRKIANAYGRRVKLIDQLRDRVRERESLAKDLTQDITEGKAAWLRENIRQNWGLIKDIGNEIDASSELLKKTTKQLDADKLKLSDVEDMRNVFQGMHNRTKAHIDDILEYRKLGRKTQAIANKEAKVLKKGDKLDRDMENYRAKIVWEKAYNKPKVQEKLAEATDRLEVLQQSRDFTQAAKQGYEAGLEGVGEVADTTVAHQMSTRAGEDPFMANLANPNYMNAPGLGDLDPLKEVRDLHQGITDPNELRRMNAVQLMAASDVALDILSPQRAAMKEAGGAPDPWGMLKGPVERDDSLEKIIPRELAEAFTNLRVDESVATQAAARDNPLMVVDPEVRKAIRDGVIDFVHEDVTKGAVTGWQRGQMAWKTYTNQLNHARSVGDRMRVAWKQMVDYLPDAYTTGKGSKRTLAPEISAEMAEAIEGMIDGTGSITAFLTKHPDMRKPMQLFLGVGRVLEQYKVTSPELRTAFRDGYFMHRYPRASEFAKRGIQVNLKGINTSLGSENVRTIDSLALAKQEYESAFKQVTEGVWDDRHPVTPSVRETHFLDAPTEDKAKILGLDYSSPEAKVKAQRTIDSVVNRLALKDPLTDPGEIMANAIQSTMEVAAMRNGLKNVAHIQLKDFKDSGLGDGARVPMRALEHNQNGTMVTRKDGTKGAMKRLDQIEGLNIHPEDTIRFGGKDFKAKELSMHPDISESFAWQFANKTKPSRGGEISRAWGETVRSLTLIGSPATHAWNILSGHWQTLSTNALTHMKRSMWEAARGVYGMDSETFKSGMKGILEGAADFVRAPKEAPFVGVVGNKMMKGELGVNPQLLMSDAILHGLNTNTWNTAFREMSQAAINLIRRDDPVLAQQFSPTRVEQAMQKEVNTGELFESLVAKDGVFRDLYELPKTGQVGKAAASFLTGVTKGATNIDYMLNQFMTYEPMRQAALASYFLTAATHWEAVGVPMMKAGVPPQVALKAVKEEAARYVNNRTGVLAHWNKVAIGSSPQNFDVESELYGSSGNAARSISASLLNATTPGWFRSKLELLSNGLSGRRLNDIESVELREYMKREWTKQLAVGLSTTVAAQQLLKFTMSGGKAGLFAAFLMDPNKPGSEEHMARIRQELEDPAQFTEIRLGSSDYALQAPFYGQLKDALNVATGVTLSPENLTKLISSNISKLGTTAIEATYGKDLRTGQDIRLGETSISPDSKVAWTKDTGEFVMRRLGNTLLNDVAQYDTYKGGFKPLSSIALNLLGLNVRESYPGDRIKKQDQDRIRYFTRATKGQTEGYVRRFMETQDYRYLEKAFDATNGVYVTGTAKNQPLLFPGGRAPIDPKTVGELIMKYSNRDLYNFNSKDPKFQASYLQQVQRVTQYRNEELVPGLVKAWYEDSKGEQK